MMKTHPLKVNVTTVNTDTLITAKCSHDQLYLHICTIIFYFIKTEIQSNFKLFAALTVLKKAEAECLSVC